MGFCCVTLSSRLHKCSTTTMPRCAESFNKYIYVYRYCYYSVNASMCVYTCYKERFTRNPEHGQYFASWYPCGEVLRTFGMVYVHDAMQHADIFICIFYYNAAVYRSPFLIVTRNPKSRHLSVPACSLCFSHEMCRSKQ